MPLAKLLVYLGLGLALLGVALGYAPGLFGWFGRLPGDIHIQSGNRSIFIPITSMAVVSLVLSLLLNLFFRR